MGVGTAIHSRYSHKHKIFALQSLSDSIRLLRMAKKMSYEIMVIRFIVGLGTQKWSCSPVLLADMPAASPVERTRPAKRSDKRTSCTVVVFCPSVYYGGARGRRDWMEGDMCRIVFRIPRRLSALSERVPSFGCGSCIAFSAV